MAAKRKATKTKTSTKRATKTRKTTTKSVEPVEIEISNPTAHTQKNIYQRLNRKQIIILGVAFVALAYYFRSFFVVARVNGSFITRSEFNKEMESDSVSPISLIPDTIGSTSGMVSS